MRMLKIAVLIFIISIIAVLLFMKIDLTAHVFASAYGTETLYWRGDVYVSAYSYGTYHEGATIARTRDGWEINEVVGDKQHNYVVIRSFLDQYLLVRENYHNMKY